VYISFLAAPWKRVPSAKSFVEKYQKLYGNVPPFAPYGYDAVMVLAEGIRKAGSVDGTKVVTALHAPDFTWDGVTGKIKFDANGQVTDRSFYFYTFDTNGNFALYE
jgi:branched-chain amino acid transport system substrate-binding protein